ncbi:MAG: hypothetical protein IJ569_08840 [Prevotella sp.]|nr:hypothetical protein [Prevotella sp.]
MVVANPIYDTVFKYLMEDERIARTILSALLKRDIVKVDVRPHEYSNNKRETLSVFRIDFAATVRESDGKEQVILIELQKTWLPTETLRFRQYLGVQYENPKNIVTESKDQHALPMVAVYLLGHCVGDIEEPVIYVHHNVYDYNEQPVTKGIPDAFIDSLTHDSIIVQIPRLHGIINNRLDEVLSIFDQNRINSENQHVLDLDDSVYAEDDIEMQRILRRLLMAASDVEMRMDMNVEDEYFSIIESRDTDIMIKTRELAEKTVLLNEKDAQLEQKDAQLEQKDAQLEQKDAQLEQMKDKYRIIIKGLLDKGMSTKDISQVTGLTTTEIDEILSL